MEIQPAVVNEIKTLNGVAFSRPVGLEAPIDYIDPKPRALVVQVPLVEYFERIKRHRADRWQRDFCSRLQLAAETRHISPTWALYHAEAQLGKTSILSQAFPAWLLGHDPLFRYALGTYNVTRSQSHSEVVIGIMQSSQHQALFPNPEGHLTKSVSKTGWMTNARRELNDGQLSFNPVGLQSGLTGSGFDWLTIDDPYADQNEAFSDTVRQNLQHFWEFTVKSRLGLYAAVAGMFHRYHVQDLAGYLLDTGEFDYIRYATQCDGPYVHKNTGRSYPDPLNREIGEYISPERRPPEYYDKVKKNPRVWNAMFQGKPTGEDGNFFDTKKIERVASIAEFELRHGKIIEWERAWDNAASENEGSAFTVGALVGQTATGKTLVADIKRKRVNTADRYSLQRETAAEDGYNVPIHIPQDPGSAGKDTSFQTIQLLQPYRAESSVVTGSKIVRAQPFSGAVNAGDVSVIEAEWTPVFLDELDDFPLSIYKDQVDAAGDGYRRTHARITRGKVLKTYDDQRNIATWQAFREKFGKKLTNNWNLYGAVKIARDASQPSAAVLIGHAPESAGIGDTIFLLAEYKKQTMFYSEIFEWLDVTVKRLCEPPFDPVYAVQFPNKPQIRTNLRVVVNDDDTEDAVGVLNRKLSIEASIAKNLPSSGIAELNWYSDESTNRHLFRPDQPGARFYWLVEPEQFYTAADEFGLRGARSEAATWSFNDRAEPQPDGAPILDCVRMILSGFATFSSVMTREEKFKAGLSDHLQDDKMKEVFGTEQFPELASARAHERTEFERKEKRETGDVDQMFNRILGGNAAMLGARKRK